MPLTNALLIRSKAKRPLVDYQISIVAPDTDMPEGQTPRFTLTCVPPPLPNDALAISIRELSFSEMGLSSDSERAKATIDLVDTFTNALMASAAAEGHVVAVESLGVHRVRFNSGFDGTWHFDWPSFNSPGDGDKHLGIRIFQPSQGTVVAASDIVAIRDNTAPTAPDFTEDPTISGSTAVGSTLHYNAGTLSGTPTPTETWVWRKNGVTIPGTANLLDFSTAGLANADSITAFATGANGVAPDATATTNAIVLTATSGPPVVINIPAIVGSSPPQVGSSQSCANFTWQGSNLTITQFWEAETTQIANSAGNSYTPVTGDVSDRLRRVEIADDHVNAPVRAQTPFTQAVVQPPAGNMTNWNLSQDWVQLDENTDGPPNNTVLFAVVGVNGPVGNVQVLGSTFITDRFKVVGSSPNFSIAASTKPVDFLGPDYGNSAVSAYPFAELTVDYALPLRVTALNGGAIVEKTVTIRPRFLKPETAGGAGGTTTLITTAQQLQAASRAHTQNPEIFRVPRTTHGSFGFYTNSGKLIFITGANPLKNKTFIGHRQIVISRDVGISITGLGGGSGSLEVPEDLVFYNCQVRVGGAVPGDSYDNRDCINVQGGKRIWIRNSSCSYAIDENSNVHSSVQSYPGCRGVRFSRNIFSLPMKGTDPVVIAATNPFQTTAGSGVVVVTIPGSPAFQNNTLAVFANAPVSLGGLTISRTKFYKLQVIGAPGNQYSFIATGTATASVAGGGSACTVKYPLHSEGGHTYGCIGSNIGELNSVWDKNVFLDFTKRMPAINMGSIGVISQNNIIVWTGASDETQATEFYRGHIELTPWHGSAMVRGNMYFNPSQNLPGVKHIGLAWGGNPDRKVRVPDKVYIPEGTDHDNIQLPSCGRPTTPCTRITRAMVASNPFDSPPLARDCLVTTQPFETDMDSELMKTDTLARQQALWDDVWLKAGCRELDGSDNIIPGMTNLSQVDYDEMTRLMAGGNPWFPLNQFSPNLYPTTIPS